jgi:hypothetical protein
MGWELALTDWLAILSVICFGAVALNEIRIVGLSISEENAWTSNPKKLRWNLAIHVALICSGIVLFICSVVTR